MWRTILLYGAFLALGAVALQWLELHWLAYRNPGDVYIALIASAFLGLGVWVGLRLGRRPTTAGFEVNTAVIATLGVSEREMEVLGELAAGKSNKEIAGKLKVSPNTVKTHVARLYEKLEVSRRTAAIQKARELGMIP